MSVPPQVPTKQKSINSLNNLEKPSFMKLKQKPEHIKSQQIIKKNKPNQSIPHVPSASTPFFSHNPKLAKSPSGSITQKLSRNLSVNQGHRSSMLPTPIPTSTIQSLGLGEKPYMLSQSKTKIRATSVIAKNQKSEEGNSSSGHI